MGWKWRLTVEWPCAIGDWLWKVLAAWPMESLRQMTARRIFVFIGTIILAALLVQTLPADIAFLMAGDLLTYYELATIASLIAARSHIREATRAAVRAARRAVRLTMTIVVAVGRRGFGLERDARARRARRLANRKPSNDGPGAIGWAVPA